MEALLDLVTENISEKSAQESLDDLLDMLSYEQSPLNLGRMKELIILASPWPEYIDPGASFILNAASHLIENHLADEFLQALAAAGYGTYQAKPRPQLLLNPPVG